MGKFNKPYNIDFCNEIAIKNNGICLTKIYKNNKTLMTWICKNKHNWESNFSNILRGSWCPYCAENVILCIDNCHIIAELNSGICLSEIYTGANSKYIWMCKNNHIWENTYHHIQQGEWCKKCHYNSLKITIEDCQKVAKINNGICLSERCNGYLDSLLWECSKNHTFIATHNSVQSGRWCPECSLFKTQNKLKDIIEKILGEKAKSNFYGFDWLKHKRKLEIDIWFPIKKLAVEYNGKQHFVPIKFHKVSDEEMIKDFKNIQKRDEIKEKLINTHKNQINYFIKIPYTEIINEENILKILKINDVI